MLEAHAEKHLDKILFPTNQGQSYILERGKYTKMAYGRLKKNWMNAEDAVQETYRTLLSYPAAGSFQRLEDLEAYFTCVLLGVISRMYRNEKAQEKHSVTPDNKYLQYSEVEVNENDVKFDEGADKTVALADENTNPESSCLAGEMSDKIRKEIDRLPFNYRTTIALSVLYEHKPSEIHDITGRSVSKISDDIYRFRKSMEDKFL